MDKHMMLVVTAAMAWAPASAASLPAAPPPIGGTMSIEPRTADGDYDPSMRAFAAGAAQALAARGFTILDAPGHAAYVAELILSRSEVGTGLARVPGQRAASVVGIGVAVPLSTGKSELVPLRRTRLELRIHKRGEAGTVWDGAAVTVREAGTPKGADATVASDLAQAVLNSYPVAPAEVIGVP